MATLKICVRNKRCDGFYPISIRVTHHRQIAYIKTEKMVNDASVSPSKEVLDPYVMGLLYPVVLEYMERLNKKDIKNWSAKEVVNFLINGDEDINFSTYAREYIAKMIDRGQRRNARNYQLAVQHLERFAGTTKLMFSQLTSMFVNLWIKSLETTKRAKEMYPVCIRQIFKAAQIEFNDYDNGIIRIKSNPWVKVNIPKPDRAEKLAITPEACREFFFCPLPESKMLYPVEELGRDVAMMTLCLAGINSVDLFRMKKTDYYDGLIHYKRAKTKNVRTDGAYFEMRVPAILQPLFEKYKNEDSSNEYLFNFYKRHTTSDSFGVNVNIGICKICQSLGIEKENDYSVYTFRHTWGTVAQNDCKASIGDVAFAMNHSSGKPVTRGYIKIDFSPAWELNEKVIDFIFFSDKPSHREIQIKEERFKLSYRYQVHAEAFFQGRKLAELTDVGFNNVDEVIDKLVEQLPDDIPHRSMVMFKIENQDKNQTVVNERMKDKGF